MPHHLLLILHLLGATVWVGGLLLLSIRILPEILRRKDPSILFDFERRFQKLGIPALLLMIISGIWMAYKLDVTITEWFSFANPIETVVSVKLSLLIATVLTVLSARLFVIPKISPDNLKIMAAHIISVTLLGVTLLVVGSFIRYGGFSI